jgi:hypothetical protein
LEAPCLIVLLLLWGLLLLLLLGVLLLLLGVLLFLLQRLEHNQTGFK